MEKKSRTVYIVLTALVVLAIAVLTLIKVLAPDQVETVPEPAAAQAPVNTAQKVIEVEKIVEVEKEISAEIIEDGLKDMGVLITQEYYFTEAVSFSSVKKLFQKITLGLTESSYLATYDGVIAAGVDFTQIVIQKDDDAKTITVNIPEARIMYTDIDPDSFVLYSEKNGIGNRISVEDFNDSLIELERNAEAKAIEKGLLEKADANAADIIGNFIKGITGDTVYTVKYVTA